MQLKNSPSSDADGMHVRPTKYVLDIFVPVVTHIFNISFEAGVFFRRMQVAKVCFTQKGDKNELGNYGPISIMPIFLKP